MEKLLTTVEVNINIIGDRVAAVALGFHYKKDSIVI